MSREAFAAEWKAVDDAYRAALKQAGEAAIARSDAQGYNYDPAPYIADTQRIVAERSAREQALHVKAFERAASAANNGIETMDKTETDMRVAQNAAYTNSGGLIRNETERRAMLNDIHARSGGVISQSDRDAARQSRQASAPQSAQSRQAQIEAQPHLALER